MNTPSFFSSLAQFFLKLVALALLLFLLVSQEAIEQRLIALKQQLNHIELQLDSLPPTTPSNSPTSHSSDTHTLESNPWINPSLPNLFRPDPFFQTILPNKLPKNFIPHGTICTGNVGVPHNLHFFSNWANVTELRSHCIPSLGKVHIGFSDIYGPDLAYRMEEREVPEENIVEYWCFLRPHITWDRLSPQLFPEHLELSPHFFKPHQVTAHDFKLTFDLYKNPFNENPSAIAYRQFFDSCQECRVIDDHTLVFRWQAKPITHATSGQVQWKTFYKAMLTTASLNPSPAFLLNYYTDGTPILEDLNQARQDSAFVQRVEEHFAKNIIASIGPASFVSFQNQNVFLKRRPRFYNPHEMLTEAYDKQFFGSQESLWLAFKHGSLDYITLNPTQLNDWRRVQEEEAHNTTNPPKIHELVYQESSYYYIGWNQNNPLFEKPSVRKALTMAIDRNRIIEEILQGYAKPLAAPLSPTSPNYSPTLEPLPFNPQEALAILKQQGFEDLDGDGILEMETPSKRIPFQFTMIYFVKNRQTKTLCEFISTQLREIGIDCQILGLDIADLTVRTNNKTFDAIHLGWGHAPAPENLEQIWSSKGMEQNGSSNFINFSNARIDEIIEQLKYEYDEQTRQSLYFEFCEIFAELQPYTLIYTPERILLYKDRVQNVFRPKDLIPGSRETVPNFALFYLKNS